MMTTARTTGCPSLSCGVNVLDTDDVMYDDEEGVVSDEDEDDEDSDL